MSNSETTPILKRKVILILFIILNIILFFLNRSIFYGIAGLNDLSFNNSTLDSIILDKIKMGLDTAGVYMDANLEPYSPEVALERWIKDKKFYIMLPNGKARYNLDLYSIGTKNPYLKKDGYLCVDTAYPGSTEFGYGMVNNLVERIIKKDEKFFYFSSVSLGGKFTNVNNSEWHDELNSGYSFLPREKVLILKDKYNISKEFEQISDFIYLLKKQYDQRGNFIEYHYDSNHKLVNITSSTGSYVKFTYSKNGLISCINNTHQDYKFLYNGKNLYSITLNNTNILELRRDKKDYIHLITNLQVNDRNFHFKYGLMGRLSNVIVDRKNNINFIYGKNITHIKYNSKSYELLASNKAIFQYKKDFDIYKCIFNDKNKLISFEKNKNKHVLSYSEKGNIIAETIDADVYEYSYDEKSNILSKIVRNKEVESQRIIEDGLVISEVNKDIGEIQYGYNDFGELNEITIENVGTFKLKRNSEGKITEVVHPDENISFFNWRGSELVSFKDQFGKQFKFTYDGKGWLSEFAPPSGTPVFDKVILKAPSVYIPKIAESLVEIDSIDLKKHLVHIKSLNRGVTYDALIDEFRRFKEIVLNDKILVSYDEDNEHNLASIRWNDDSFVRMQLEDKNILNYLTSDGVHGKIKYAGDKISMTNVDKDLRIYKYDKQGRIIQKLINIMAYSFRYSPKVKDKIYSISYPDKSKTLYSYGVDGKIKSIIFNNSYIIKFEYPGELSRSIIFPNNIIQTDEFDEAGLTTSTIISNTDGDSMKELYYFYDNKKFVAGSQDGKRVQVLYSDQNTITGFSHQAKGKYAYKFNEQGSLVEFNAPKDHNVLYKRDDEKNITLVLDSKKFIPVTTTTLKGKLYDYKFNFLEINGIGSDEKQDFYEQHNFSIKPGLNEVSFNAILTSGNKLNQTLSFFVHPEASTIYKYDDNQRLESIRFYGKQLGFKWTAFNQLKFINTLPGKSLKISYLPNGLRANYVKDDKTVFYAYDIYGNIIEEISFTGRSKIKYIYDYKNNKLLMSYDGKNVRFYNTDAFGSVISIYAKDGKNLADYSYSPYGEMIIKNEQIMDNKVGFLGLHKDLETGYYFFKEGYFDSENIIFYPSKYLSPWDDLRSMDINVNLSSKIRSKKLLSYNNDILDWIRIPYEISFNKDFIWTDYVATSKKIEHLKTYLTHKGR